MTDHLATLLAAEEHRQGAPYTADPGHCGRCADVDRAWAQAVCGHEVYVDITSCGKRVLERLCQQCGDVREVAA